MNHRRYDYKKDRDAGLRIWKEVGWADGESGEKAYDAFLKATDAWVTEISGSPECLVIMSPGTLRYLDEELALAACTGVATSRVARKQGLAGQLTALALADRAAAGDHVAMLGIFEQGYYNQLGFGNGSYMRSFTFDPARLVLPQGGTPRTPIRLTVDDWQEIHDCRIRRIRYHGSCQVFSPELTHAELLWSENGFGLGYRDKSGALTHHVWCSAKAVEHGPYSILWMAYQSREQFLELLGLLRGLGDQVRSIRMVEPPQVQMQDIIRQPFAARQLTEGSPHANRARISAWWQARILDLETCMDRTHLHVEPIRFNLVLSDPISGFLSPDAPWHGLGGEYVIRLGKDSSAQQGTDSRLPTLHASIGAFTRLWLGLRSATGLSWTDELQGPEDLLHELDRTMRLPGVNPDWDF